MRAAHAGGLERLLSSLDHSAAEQALSQPQRQLNIPAPLALLAAFVLAPGEPTEGALRRKRPLGRRRRPATGKDAATTHVLSLHRAFSLLSFFSIVPSLFGALPLSVRHPSHGGALS